MGLYFYRGVQLIALISLFSGIYIVVFEGWKDYLFELNALVESQWGEKTARDSADIM